MKELICILVFPLAFGTAAAFAVYKLTMRLKKPFFTLYSVYVGVAVFHILLCLCFIFSNALQFKLQELEIDMAYFYNRCTSAIERSILFFCIITILSAIGFTAEHYIHQKEEE